MSAAGFLAKLLNGGEVAWKPLGDVVGIQRGRRLIRSQLEETGKFAVFQNSLKPLGFYHDSNVEADTAFVICAGAAGEIGYSASKFWAADDVHFIRTPNWILSKYVYHWLLTQRSKISAQVRKASIPRLSKSVVELLDFPIPCPDDPQKSLAVQEEIVRILDKFAELTNELTNELSTELAARKKQYNHYRDRLLSFEGGNVEWKPLDEIGEFIRGKRFTKADYVDEGIGAIHYGEIYTQYGVFAHKTHSKVRSDMAASLRYAEPSDVVIAGVSETIEDVGKAVAWLGEEKVAIHDDSYAFRHNMNPKFIAYAMQTDSFHDQKAKYVSSGKIKRLLIDGVKNVRLPIPYPDDPAKSLEEQTRIVAILDKFDTLTTSISQGLPREIELREKQYAYYRDQLLSFPKPDVEAA